MRSKQWKKDELGRLRKMAKDYPVVALASFRDVPADQFQSLRKELTRDGTVVRVVKNSLLRRLLGNGRKALEPHIADQTALLLSKQDPFRLFKRVDAHRRKAPLKPGSVAPGDIEVPAGPTPFKPGPVLAELQAAGFPAAVEAGKVVLRKSFVAVKKGERVDAKRADILAKMEIKPLDQGVSLRAVLEGETLYLPEVLRIDGARTAADFALAASQARGFALELGLPEPDILPELLARACRKAMALAVEGEICEPAAMEAIFAKALRRAKAVQGILPPAAS
ncbi:MAG: 50S ribosomal protein L10 [Halobacteria archaeon]